MNSGASGGPRPETPRFGPGLRSYLNPNDTQVARVTRALLWLNDQRIRLIATWQTRRMFCGGHLTPEARWQLSRTPKRRTP